MIRRHPFTQAKEDLRVLFTRYSFEALELEDDESLMELSPKERLADFLKWVDEHSPSLDADDVYGL